MKQLEQMPILFAVAGILMKLFLIPGGDVVLAISLITLALVYYPFGFLYFNDVRLKRIFDRRSYKGITVPRGVATFLGGLIFSVLATGVLFKLLLLPGDSQMITVGLMGAAAFFVALTVRNLVMKKSSPLARRMMARTLLWSAVSIGLLLTPSRTLVKIFYRDHPQYVEAFEKAIENPENEELRLRAEQMRLDIQD